MACSIPGAGRMQGCARGSLPTVTCCHLLGQRVRAGDQVPTALRPESVQALKSSECYTDDIEKAQAVYVYDYCYYIWWLATLHSRGGEMTTSPGDHLIQVTPYAC